MPVWGVVLVAVLGLNLAVLLLAGLRFRRRSDRGRLAGGAAPAATVIPLHLTGRPVDGGGELGPDEVESPGT